MDGIIYLTLEQAELIHKKTIKYSGGGIYESLDIGKLDSVLLTAIKGLQLHYHYKFYYLMGTWELQKTLCQLQKISVIMSLLGK